jgi:hypothetical protein
MSDFQCLGALGFTLSWIIGQATLAELTILSVRSQVIVSQPSESGLVFSFVELQALLNSSAIIFIFIWSGLVPAEKVDRALVIAFAPHVFIQVLGADWTVWPVFQVQAVSSHFTVFVFTAVLVHWDAFAGLLFVAITGVALTGLVARSACQ